MKCRAFCRWVALLGVVGAAVVSSLRATAPAERIAFLALEGDHFCAVEHLTEAGLDFETPAPFRCKFSLRSAAGRGGEILSRDRPDR